MESMTSVRREPRHGSVVVGDGGSGFGRIEGWPESASVIGLPVLETRVLGRRENDVGKEKKFWRKAAGKGCLQKEQIFRGVRCSAVAAATGVNSIVVGAFNGILLIIGLTATAMAFAVVAVASSVYVLFYALFAAYNRLLECLRKSWRRFVPNKLNQKRLRKSTSRAALRDFRKI